MADGIDFKLTGIEQLVATMNDVQYETKRKGGRFALRKAAVVVKDAAAANAKQLDDPATAEEISKNIAVRWNGRVFKRTGDPSFRVGVLGGARAVLTDRARKKTERRRKRLGQTSLDDLGEIAGAGKGNPGGDTFYWRFLEFGTERSRARPFMRPAVDQAGQRAVNTFITEYQKALDRAIRRSQRQGTQA